MSDLPHFQFVNVRGLCKNGVMSKGDSMCEDYPCCGHTDGLGCNYVPDMDFYYRQAQRAMDDDYYMYQD